MSKCLGASENSVQLVLLINWKCTCTKLIQCKTLTRTWASCRRGPYWHIHAGISERSEWGAASADQCWGESTASCSSCSSKTDRQNSAVQCYPPHRPRVPPACVGQSLLQTDLAYRSNSYTQQQDIFLRFSEQVCQLKSRSSFQRQNKL